MLHPSSKQSSETATSPAALSGAGNEDDGVLIVMVFMIVDGLSDEMIVSVAIVEKINRKSD